MKPVPIAQVIHLNSGPHMADGEPAIHRFTAPHAMWLTAATLWTGCDLGQIADIAMHVWRESDNALVAFQHWDHYADPTTSHHEYRNWWPRYWELAKGDSLRLESRGHNIVIPRLNVHHIALVEWIFPQT